MPRPIETPHRYDNLIDALIDWGEYAHYDEGFARAYAVKTFMEEIFGPLDQVTIPRTRGNISLYFRDMPGASGLTVAWGYVYVTPAAVKACQRVDRDLAAELAERGLETDPADGKTIWHSRGRRRRNTQAS